MQVSVFADRVEVRNPGSLTPPLTTDKLRLPHSSIARNHRLCEGLFLARFIEKYGTGTLMMIRECRAHALPEPEFSVAEGEFVVTLWRDWLTDARLNQFPLSPSQRLAIVQLKTSQRLTKGDYQRTASASARTALRELSALAQWGLIIPVGQGRNVHYVLAPNRAIIAPIAPTPAGSHPSTPLVVTSPPTEEDIAPKRLNKGSALATPPVLPSSAPPDPSFAHRLKGALGTKSAPSRHQVEIARKCHKESSLLELMHITGRTDRTKFRHQVLNPLITAGVIEPTHPDKPNSRLQKYRLTAQSRSWLASTH